MDILEIRKQNLIGLLKEYKTQQAFANAVDTAPARISQIMTGQLNNRGKPISVGNKFARQIEEKLNLPHGWMDSAQFDNTIIEASEDGKTTAIFRPQAQRLGASRPIVQREIPDEINIPMFDVAFSMGYGAYQPENIEVVSKVSVSPAWVNNNLPYITGISNLGIAPGRGDSMEGTYNDGDLLIIDGGVNDVRIDAVYALMLNGELYVKRLQRRTDGSILMISDNKRYEAQVIKNGELANFQVLGRVVWVWNGKRL